MWRETDNPYFILTAEIMLQRTTAGHVKKVYGDFIKKYPFLGSLAAAHLDDVEKILKTLGLRYRCKLLIKAANFIIDNYGGVIPHDRSELLSVPGVGDYVAGMIVNSAFCGREYVVDTNIARIFNRVLGLNMHGDISKNKEIVKYASVYFDISDSRGYAYSIVDFGAMVCKNIKPRCTHCQVARYGVCMYQFF